MATSSHAKQLLHELPFKLTAKQVSGSLELTFHDTVTVSLVKYGFHSLGSLPYSENMLVSLAIPCTKTNERATIPSHDEASPVQCGGITASSW